MTRRWLFSLSLCTAAALAGCSTGPRMVEGQVQSFSTMAAVPAPATYRIDRLPSQQVPSFDPIAALAEQALARVGLQRDDAAPRLLVQIGVQAGVVPRYDPAAPYGFYGPFAPWGWGGWYGRGRGGWGIGGSWAFYEPSPLHRRAVSLMLRDAATQAVVYETSAVHEDIWVSDPGVYGVLFDAALTGFPTPPQGPREVRLPMPMPMQAPMSQPRPTVMPTPAPATRATP